MNRDADYDMAELTRQGNIAYDLKKKGICLHGRRQGPGFCSNPQGDSKCLDCGKKGTWEQLDWDRDNYL